MLRQELKINLEIDEIIENMSKVAIRLALRDATIIGACDGEFQEEEINFLRELAKRCELDNEDLNRLFQWVDHGWSWLQDSREWLNLDNENVENATVEGNE